MVLQLTQLLREEIFLGGGGWSVAARKSDNLAAIRKPIV
jgi:hypothetical protein